MRIRETGRPGEREFLLTLEPGEKVMESLREEASKRRLGGAWISGLGAVRDAELGWFDTVSKEYVTRTFADVLELLSFVGNAGRAGDEVVVHAHVVCAGRDLHAVGGHLVEATSAVTVELRMIETGTELAREVDGRFGLKLLNLRDDGREAADPSPSRTSEA